MVKNAAAIAERARHLIAEIMSIPATKENGLIAFCIGSTTSIISRPNCGIDRAIVAITMLIEVVAYSSAPRFSFGGEGRGCCTPNFLVGALPKGKG